MEQNFSQYIEAFFYKLIELYGFKVKSELNENQSYMIEYSSEDFVIKIEKYFKEFYASIYKVDKLDDEINLFNLLEYLKQNDDKIPKSEYFRKEQNIDECYKKQLNHISSVIYENYNLINDFYNYNYESNIIRFKIFWKSKHPELYN